MHVDVEVAAWHRYPQVDEGVGTLRKDVLVSRFDGPLDGRALDQPVVDEEDELGPLSGEGWVTGRFGLGGSRTEKGGRMGIKRQDRQRETQKDKEIRQTKREREAERQRGRQAGRQSGGQAGRQTRQTGIGKSNAGTAINAFPL